MQDTEKIIKPTIEEQILYQASLDYIFDHYNKIAFFGETELTEKILSIASPHHKKIIKYIVTDNPLQIRTQNIPVTSTKTKPNGIDLVIVCADKNEKEYLDKARKWAGESTDYFAAITDSIMLIATRTPQNKPKEGWPTKMYILCTGQRTGSTMLITLLKKTRVLGLPTEQFRVFLKEHVEKGIIFYDEILPEIFKRYQTPNGVFGVKIHGYQYPIFKEAINSIHGRNREKINNLIKDSSYVFLVRDNLYRQAISLWRAQKTKTYHIFNIYTKRPFKKLIEDLKGMSTKEIVNNVKRSLRREGLKKPTYRYDEVRKSLVQVIEERNTWQSFFEKRNIQPLVLKYETFINQIPETITNIANHVGVDVPKEKNLSEPPTKKMSDEYTEEVLRRFKRDLREIDPQLINKIEHSQRSSMTLESI